MTCPSRIPAAGRVVEVLKNGCCRAELPNGKIVFAFPGKKLRPSPPRSLRAGERILLELSPFDFSKAEITGFENF